MKRIKLLLTFVLALGFGVAGFGQYTTDTILYWRFANPVVIPGSPSYAQFDVEISAEFSGTWHTDLQMYFDYNTVAFGTNIVQNSKVTFEKLEMLAGDLAGSPKYVIYGPQDNTDSTFAILTEAQFKIIGSTFMNEVPMYPTFAGFLRITIEIADDSELAGINFAESLMDNWQYFISTQHPLQGQIPWKYNNPCSYENDLNNWVITPPDLANLYISEVVDPSTPDANAKFVELYNGESFDVDLGYYNVYFSRQVNGGTTWGDLALTAVIPAGATYVIGYQTTAYQTAYQGTNASIYTAVCSGNGNDAYFLYVGGNHTSGTMYDAYGVLNEDGIGKAWEYTDGHAVRKRTVNGPNPTWTASEWTILRQTTGVLLTGTQMTPFQHKATRTWAGTTSTDWNARGNNWDGTGFVPDASDIVNVPNTVNDPVITLHSACHDLTIATAAHFYQNAGTFMTVNGTLTNNAGNDRLILRSNSTATASLLQTTAGVGATAERYLSESQWHYISSPISDGFSGIYENIYLKSWDETTAAWTYIVPLNVSLNAMQGYASFASPLYTGNTTVEHTGTLNVGANSISTTYTAGAPEANRGWNFVGNPYTTAVDWLATGWTKTNIKDKIQMWNPTAGNYGVFDNTVIPATSTNNVTNIIPQTNGFFVDNVDGQATGALGVTDAVRLHSTKAFFKSSGYVPEGQLKLSVHSNGYFDESVIRFAEISNGAYDAYDTPKWDGIEQAPQLFTMDQTGFRYSINTMPGIEGNEVVPVGFSIDTDGAYTLNVEGIENFDITIPVFLEDLFTGEFYDLRAN
ncbi:MAG: lamin tail domain-containing protein, partial [Bacteroidales bacterium]|nr:lamin tail domain-containing protein [Bacteroidales bacterium]